MKFLAVLSTLIAGAFAQSITIALPTDGSTIPTGSQIVDVARFVSFLKLLLFTLVTRCQDTLTGSTEVAIVISIIDCFGDGSCPDPTQELGTILYNGPFNPQFPPAGSRGNPAENEPQQNFTVTIPESFAGHKALLNVVHLAIVGVRKAYFKFLFGY
jgi:hypothetical protein